VGCLEAAEDGVDLAEAAAETEGEARLAAGEREAGAAPAGETETD
jgi:hypothetical protein